MANCCEIFLVILIVDLLTLAISLVGNIWGFVKDDVMFVLKWWGVANVVFVGICCLIIVCCDVSNSDEKSDQRHDFGKETFYGTPYNKPSYGAYYHTSPTSNYSHNWQNTTLDSPRIAYSDNERTQLKHKNAYVRIENETRNNGSQNRNLTSVGDKTAVSKDEPTTVSLDLHGYRYTTAIRAAIRETQRRHATPANLNTPCATYSDNERKQLHHENAYVCIENETRNNVRDKTAVSKDEPTTVSLDLHGHHLKKAIQKVKKTISEEPKGTIVEIITGRGMHSEDGKPVIKPAVEKLLTSKGYEQTWTAKGGMVTFTL